MLWVVIVSCSASEKVGSKLVAPYLASTEAY